MRAVLDVNILIAALLSPAGTPAELVSRWLAGEFELVTSEALLAELAQALAYPEVRRHVRADEATTFVRMLRSGTLVAPDPPNPSHRSADPGDDYLVALAEAERAVLVSGDQHLLELADRFPIETAREFLDRVAGEGHG